MLFWDVKKSFAMQDTSVLTETLRRNLKTIDKHRPNELRKMEGKSSAALLTLAMRGGLIVA